MKVEARLHGFDDRTRSVDVADDATYLDLLRALRIPAESVVVFEEDRPVPVDSRVEPTRACRIVRVFSGG